MNQGFCCSFPRLFCVCLKHWTLILGPLCLPPVLVGTSSFQFDYPSVRRGVYVSWSPVKLPEVHIVHITTQTSLPRD